MKTSIRLIDEVALIQELEKEEERWMKNGEAGVVAGILMAICKIR